MFTLVYQTDFIAFFTPVLLVQRKQTPPKTMVALGETETKVKCFTLGGRGGRKGVVPGAQDSETMPDRAEQFLLSGWAISGPCGKRVKQNGGKIYGT